MGAIRGVRVFRVIRDLPRVRTIAAVFELPDGTPIAFGGTRRLRLPLG
jgi:hypothetical protein